MTTANTLKTLATYSKSPTTLARMLGRCNTATLDEQGSGGFECTPLYDAKASVLHGCNETMNRTVSDDRCRFDLAYLIVGERVEEVAAGIAHGTQHRLRWISCDSRVCQDVPRRILQWNEATRVDREMTYWRGRQKFC